MLPSVSCFGRTRFESRDFSRSFDYVLTIFANAKLKQLLMKDAFLTNALPSVNTIAGVVNLFVFRGFFMTVSDVLSISVPVTTTPGTSHQTSPNPTPELSEIVSVACAAVSQLESTGPSHLAKKREFSCEKRDEGAPLPKKQRPSPENAEESLVEERRTAITNGLTAWKLDYEPSPSFWLSFVPGVSNIVRKESLSAVAIFMEKVARARTRRKLISVLEKNRGVLSENMFCMNTATEAKMVAACELIDKELTKLKAYGPLLPKEKTDESKKEKTLQSDDPLYRAKVPVWKRFGEWQKGFVPSPAGIFSLVPGIAAKLKNITDRLFADLLRDIRKAQSLASLAERLKDHGELMHEYTAFVDTATAARMEAACSLLQEEAKALPTP
jgi:hypothetical protein